MNGKEEERLLFREVPLVGNEKDGRPNKKALVGGCIIVSCFSANFSIVS